MSLKHKVALPNHPKVLYLLSEEGSTLRCRRHQEGAENKKLDKGRFDQWSLKENTYKAVVVPQGHRTPLYNVC